MILVLEDVRTNLVVEEIEYRVEADEFPTTIEVEENGTTVVVTGPQIVNTTLVIDPEIQTLVVIDRDVPSIITVAEQGPPGSVSDGIVAAVRFKSLGPSSLTLIRDGDGVITSVVYADAETITINRDGNGLITGTNDGTTVVTVNRDGDDVITGVDVDPI